MDPLRVAVLLAGAFFLVFGLAAYRHFYTVLGATAGLAIWVATRDTLIRIPGLRENPGTSGLLLLVLLLLAGVFFASRFRRLLVFFAGLGTGLILSQAFSFFMAEGILPGAGFRFGRIDAMDVLVGLIGGALFLLFEGFFAVVLTSVVGSFLCTWAVGGKWTFPACIAVGIVAQILVFRRLKPPSPGTGNRDKTGLTAFLVFCLLVLIPCSAAADWVVERTSPSNSRVVLEVGWRDGVRKGESYAVMDENGSLVVEIAIGEVFSTSSYSESLPREDLKRVRAGMRITTMEEYEFQLAVESGGETKLEDFLRKYPDSSYRETITQELDEARYKNAEVTGTIEAFREFQRKYPTSRYASEARKREEELAFKRARDLGTEETLGKFLQMYSGSPLISDMVEVRAFLKARQTGKVYAYQDFLAAYPRGRLADEFIPYIDEFELWVEKMEFGENPAEAIVYFGELGDETAIPFLVGKLNVEDLEIEARKAIQRIGTPALDTLMEVLISPLQSVELKDKVALIIGEMGEMSTIPAMRTYVKKENTAAGHKALLMLEEKIGR